MGGGLMQLVAYGAQDVYLTGNPQITFFKVVYRRHTNFACEVIEQTFNGSASLGSRATVPITRNGDLVTQMYLKTTLTATKGADAANDVAKNRYTTFTLGTTADTDSFTSAATVAETITANAADNDSRLNNNLKFTFGSGHALAGTEFVEGDMVEVTNTAVTATDLVKDLVAVKYFEVYDCEANILRLKNPTNITISVDEAFDDAPVMVFKKATTATTYEWANDVGYALISSVELQVGGTKIDKHYGRWMHIWSQLTRTSEHDDTQAALLNMKNTELSKTLYVPLQFFCCRNDGLALPLIALQYHDVRLEFEFNSAANLIQGHSTVKMENTSLLVNYIYLDSEERKRFAQASHEYLIEQLQFTGVETVTASSANKLRLNFNHPVKEVVWAVEKANVTTGVSKLGFGNFTTNFLGDGVNTTSKALLQLNGHDRFSEETGDFFGNLQPYQHHSRTPSNGVNLYSFALNPEEHQPSGTCNFSRIDNATLTITTTANSGTSMYVYGVNYNVLRIMSGMGGVAYSN
jgi:hypothetical protein